MIEILLAKDAINVKTTILVLNAISFATSGHVMETEIAAKILESANAMRNGRECCVRRASLVYMAQLAAWHVIIL